MNQLEMSFVPCLIGSTIDAPIHYSRPFMYHSFARSIILFAFTCSMFSLHQAQASSCPEGQELSSDTETCEYREAFKDTLCKLENGPAAYYDHSLSSCQCTPSTMPNSEDAYCIEYTTQQLEAKNELRLAFQERIALMGIKDQDAFGSLAITYFGVDSIENVQKRLDTIHSIRSWKGMTWLDTIEKAVSALSDHSIVEQQYDEITAKQSALFDISTNSTWIMLLAGQINASKNTNIFVATPTAVIMANGGAYEASFDPESYSTTITSFDEDMDLYNITNGVKEHVRAGQTATTFFNKGEGFDQKLAFTSTNAADGISCFSDTDGHHYETAICSAYEQGIVQGYSDGTYKPDNNINRAEFTKIIITTYFDGNSREDNSCFSDVGKEWYAAYICDAKFRNIVSGYGDGSFKPGGLINLAEGLKILLETVSTIRDFTIKDTDGPWFQKYLNVANELDIMSNINQDLAAPLTRGEMAELIYQINQ